MGRLPVRCAVPTVAVSGRAGTASGFKRSNLETSTVCLRLVLQGPLAPVSEGERRAVGGWRGETCLCLAKSILACASLWWAAYLYSRVADVAALTGEQKLTWAIDRLWEDVVCRRLYLTGGIGATGLSDATRILRSITGAGCRDGNDAAGNVHWRVHHGS